MEKRILIYGTGDCAREYHNRLSGGGHKLSGNEKEQGNFYGEAGYFA